jgi:hypothetical protein
MIRLMLVIGFMISGFGTTLIGLEAGWHGPEHSVTAVLVAQPGTSLGDTPERHVHISPDPMDEQGVVTGLAVPSRQGIRLRQSLPEDDSWFRYAAPGLERPPRSVPSA